MRRISTNRCMVDQKAKTKGVSAGRKARYDQSIEDWCLENPECYSSEVRMIM
jgi:hypothetical protein